MLDYEQSLTRECPVPKSVSSAPDDKAYYNTSAHFIWIGDRTRQIDGGHVEYFRGIRNPIGIKVGPSMQSDELVRLLDSNCMFYLLDHLLTNPCLVVVNPEKIPGRVTLISRYGADKVGFFFDLSVFSHSCSDRQPSCGTHQGREGITTSRYLGMRPYAWKVRFDLYLNHPRLDRIFFVLVL